MTLADTSAWVEFMRGTGSRADAELGNLLQRRRVATTEPVLMEVLAGARGRQHELDLRRLLALATLIPLGGAHVWEMAASIYRVCRGAGTTPRSHIDCLIAAVAIREDVPLLHADRDFNRVAEHTPLRLVPG